MRFRKANWRHYNSLHLSPPLVHLGSEFYYWMSACISCSTPMFHSSAWPPLRGYAFDILILTVSCSRNFFLVNATISLYRYSDGSPTSWTGRLWWTTRSSLIVFEHGKVPVYISFHIKHCSDNSPYILSRININLCETTVSNLARCCYYW